MKILSASDSGLTYYFGSDPDPIIVSEPNNLRKTTLQVIISNSTMDTITLDEIQIKIPVGSNAAGTLSVQDLPQPTYDTDQPWVISSDGSIVTITSNNGEPLEITSKSISFKLEAIVINEVEGNVLISTSDGSDGFLLTKRPADFPVTNFYAEPQICYASGTTITLYWECTEAGKDYAYKIYPLGIPNDEIYLWQAGVDGVSQVVYATTTFVLEILKSDGSSESLQLTVPVILPQFYNTDYQFNVNGNQRLVKLWWTAVDAAYCDIKVNEEIYLSNVPLDTNPEGYLFFIGENDFENTTIDIRITVVAYAKEGNSKTTYNVPFSLMVKSATQHVMLCPTPKLYTAATSGQNNTFGIGINPNNTQLFVMGLKATTITSGTATYAAWSPVMNKITLPSFNCENVTLANPEQMIRVTNIVGTNSTAYTAINAWYASPDWNTQGKLVTYFKQVTLSNNKVASNTYNTCGDVGLSLSSNEQYVFSARSPDSSVSKGAPSGVLCINTNDLATEPTQLVLDQKLCCHTSVAPNDPIILVTNRDSNSVSVVSSQTTSNQLTLQATLSVGTAPIMTCFTPDGKLALVANSGSNDISFIKLDTVENLDTVEVEKTIKVEGAPFSIAITADSAYAYVVNKNDGTLVMIDIIKGELIPGSFAVGNAPVAIAITTTSQPQLLMIQENSTTLTSMWV